MPNVKILAFLINFGNPSTIAYEAKNYQFFDTKYSIALANFTTLTISLKFGAFLSLASMSSDRDG